MNWELIDWYVVWLQRIGFLGAVFIIPTLILAAIGYILSTGNYFSKRH
jgi:hypothetical protein